MRQKFWKTKRFKELQQEWLKKLEQSGFIDEEKILLDDWVLKQYASNIYRQANPIQRDTKCRYYELLGFHLHQENFQDPIEKVVMEKRAKGILIREISEDLKERGERCHRETIRLIIQKYERKWGIK